MMQMVAPLPPFLAMPNTSGDHVVSYPQLVSQGSKGTKVKEKKKMNRSSTFRSKLGEDKPPAGGGSGGAGQGNSRSDV